MALTDQIFPQTGDPNDGERFAQMIGQQNTLQYVEDGLDVTADFGAGSISVTEGVCFIGQTSATANTGSDEIRSLGLAVQVASGSLSIQYSDDNYVVVEANYGSQNDVSLAVYESLADASDTSLAIAHVDNQANTVTALNRAPSILAENLTVTHSVTAESDATVNGSLTVDSSIDANETTSNVLDATAQLDIPVYSDDTNSPVETYYFNDTDETLKYKDTTGTLHLADEGGDTDATYVTHEPESGLANSIEHADLSGADLHDPAAHGVGSHTYQSRISLGPGHHIEYETGLTDEEIARVDLQPGRSLYLERLEFTQKGGGSNADTEIDVYDEDDGTVIGTVSLGGRSLDSGSTTEGASVLLRLSQNTGSAIVGSPIAVGRIE